MKTRNSDFQPQQPPHMAPFSPSPPPLILGGGRLTQPLPGSRRPQDPSRLGLGTRRGNLLGWVVGKSCQWPPETRWGCKSHMCSCWDFMPSDATITSRQHRCCAANLLPLHCAAYCPTPCLSPLPLFSPCSFLSLLFSVILPFSFFFFFFLLCYVFFL